MSKAQGEGDTKSSIASPDTAVTSTSTADSEAKSKDSTLPKLGTSPTTPGGEGEVSSTSTSEEDAGPWNFHSSLDDALAGDKNPFIGMSEEDISQIESALCSEEGKKILQQTSLEDLASPLNSMEEDDGEETGPPTEEDGLNGTDMSMKLVEGDFELDESILKDGINLNLIGDPVLTGFQGTSHAYSSDNEKEEDSKLQTKTEESDGTSDEKSDAKIGNKPKPIRRSTRIQDQEQRDMAEKIRKENLEREQKALEALAKAEDSQSENDHEESLEDSENSGMGKAKQYNMRTMRPKREDGRVEYTVKAKPGVGKKTSQTKIEFSTESDDGDEGDDEKEMDQEELEEGEVPKDVAFMNPDNKEEAESEVVLQTKPKGKGKKGMDTSPVRGKGKRNVARRGRGAKSNVGKEQTETVEEAPKHVRGRGRGRGRGRVRGVGTRRGGKRQTDYVGPENEEKEDSDVSPMGSKLFQTADTTEDNQDDTTPTASPQKGKRKKGASVRGRKGKMAVTVTEHPIQGEEEQMEVSTEIDTEAADNKAPTTAKDDEKPKKTPGKKGKKGKAALLKQASAHEPEESEAPQEEKTTKASGRKPGKRKKKAAQAADNEGEKVSNVETEEGMDIGNDAAEEAPRLECSDDDHPEEEDNDDSEWGPEDDPEKLWCICKKPYNNRFMICCDTCEMWYHGSCVGVTKRRGKEMAKNNVQWICEACEGTKLERKSQPTGAQEYVLEAEETKVSHSETDEHHEDSDDRGLGEGGANTKGWAQKTEQHKELVSQLQEKLEALKKKRTEKDVPEMTSPEGSAPEKVTEDVKEEPETATTSRELKKETKRKRSKEKKEKVKESLLPAAMREKCTMCSANSKEGSVYCSETCINKHAEESLQFIEQERSKMYGNRPSSQGSQERIVVFERKTGKILTGPAAPTDITLTQWLEKHPTFEVLRSGQQVGQSAASFYAQKKEKERLEAKKQAKQKEKERREKEMLREKREAEKKKREEKGKERQRAEMARKQRESKQIVYSGGLDPLRIGVRKSLRDNLNQRANSADDVMLSAAEIKKLALEIEDELYKYYGAVSSKYKSKYKVMIFNIKDPENKGLFRRILHAELKPAKLVRLTEEQMSSKELAKWKESQSEIDICELDKEESPPKTPRRTSDAYTSHASWIVDPQADILSSIIVDSTASHGKHFFDLNCKICTGRQPEKEVEPASKKARVSFTSTDENKSDSGGKGQAYDYKSRPDTSNSGSFSQNQDFIHHDPFCVRDSSTYKVESSTASSVPSPKATVPPPLSTVAESEPNLVKTVEAKPIVKVSDSKAVERTGPTDWKASIPQIKVAPDTVMAPEKTGPPDVAVWKGSIFAPDVCKFLAQAEQVSGYCENILAELPDTINIMGRLPPENVFDYLSKIKGHHSNREIVIIKFDAKAGSEKTLYTELFTYLEARNRCGVVGSCSHAVKDMYVVPLAAGSQPPSVLLPFDGPGLSVDKPNMLLGVIVKQKSKRVKKEPAPAKTWMYSERHDAESTNRDQPKRIKIDPKFDTKAVPKEIPIEAVSHGTKPLAPDQTHPIHPKPPVSIKQDPRKPPTAIGPRDPRQRNAQPVEEQKPPLVPTEPSTTTETLVDNPLAQAEPQNPLQAAILARAKAQMEAAKAKLANTDTNKESETKEVPSKSTSAEELSPPKEVEADEYSSSDNEEIDASHIDDPIIQAYAKEKPKKRKSSPVPDPSEGDEPYDPYCPTLSTEDSNQPIAVQELTDVFIEKQLSDSPNPSTSGSTGENVNDASMQAALRFTQLLQQTSMGSFSADMTAAMLATLAATSATRSLDEQRLLLQTLTNQVDEQKKILERQKDEAIKRSSAENTHPDMPGWDKTQNAGKTDTSEVIDISQQVEQELGTIPLPPEGTLPSLKKDYPAYTAEHRHNKLISGKVVDSLEIDSPASPEPHGLTGETLETPGSPDAEEISGESKSRSRSSTPPLIPIDYGKETLITNVARERLAKKVGEKAAPDKPVTSESVPVKSDVKEEQETPKPKSDLDVLSALLTGKSFENLKNIVAKAQQVDPQTAKAEVTKKGDVDLRTKKLPPHVLNNSGNNTPKSNPDDDDFVDDELEAALNDPGGLTNIGKYYEKEHKKKLQKLKEQMDQEKEAVRELRSAALAKSEPKEEQLSANPFGLELNSGESGDVDYRKVTPISLPLVTMTTPLTSGICVPSSLSESLNDSAMLKVLASAVKLADKGVKSESSKTLQWQLDEDSLPHIPGLGDIDDIPIPKAEVFSPEHKGSKEKVPTGFGTFSPVKIPDSKEDDIHITKTEQGKSTKYTKESTKISRNQPDKERNNDKEEGELSDTERPDTKSRSPRRRRSRSRSRERRKSRSPRRRRERSRDRDSRSKDQKWTTEKRSRSRDRRQRARSRSRDRRLPHRSRSRFGRFGRVSPMGDRKKRSRSRSPRFKDKEERKNKLDERSKDDKERKKVFIGKDKGSNNGKANLDVVIPPSESKAPTTEIDVKEAPEKGGPSDLPAKQAAFVTTQTFDYGHGVGPSAKDISEQTKPRILDVDDRINFPPMGPGRGIAKDLPLPSGPHGPVEQPNSSVSTSNPFHSVGSMPSGNRIVGRGRSGLPFEQQNVDQIHPPTSESMQKPSLLGDYKGPLLLERSSRIGNNSGMGFIGRNEHVVPFASTQEQFPSDSHASFSVSSEIEKRDTEVGEWGEQGPFHERDGPLPFGDRGPPRLDMPRSSWPLERQGGGKRVAEPHLQGLSHEEHERKRNWGQAPDMRRNEQGRDDQRVARVGLLGECPPSLMTTFKHTPLSGSEESNWDIHGPPRSSSSLMEEKVTDHKGLKGMEMGGTDRQGKSNMDEGGQKSQGMGHLGMFDVGLPSAPNLRGVPSRPKGAGFPLFHSPHHESQSTVAREAERLGPMDRDLMPRQVGPSGERGSPMARDSPSRQEDSSSRHGPLGRGISFRHHSALGRDVPPPEHLLDTNKQPRRFGPSRFDEASDRDAPSGRDALYRPDHHPRNRPPQEMFMSDPNEPPDEFGVFGQERPPGRDSPLALSDHSEKREGPPRRFLPSRFQELGTDNLFDDENNCDNQTTLDETLGRGGPLSRFGSSRFDDPPEGIEECRLEGVPSRFDGPPQRVGEFRSDGVATPSGHLLRGNLLSRGGSSIRGGIINRGGPSMRGGPPLLSSPSVGGGPPGRGGQSRRGGIPGRGGPQGRGPPPYVDDPSGRGPPLQHEGPPVRGPPLHDGPKGRGPPPHHDGPPGRRPPLHHDGPPGRGPPPHHDGPPGRGPPPHHDGPPGRGPPPHHDGPPGRGPPPHHDGPPGRGPPPHHDGPPGRGPPPHHDGPPGRGHPLHHDGPPGRGPPPPHDGPPGRGPPFQHDGPPRRFPPPHSDDPSNSGPLPQHDGQTGRGPSLYHVGLLGRGLSPQLDDPSGGDPSLRREGQPFRGPLPQHSGPPRRGPSPLLDTPPTRVLPHLDRKPTGGPAPHLEARSSRGTPPQHDGPLTRGPSPHHDGPLSRGPPPHNDGPPGRGPSPHHDGSQRRDVPLHRRGAFERDFRPERFSPPRHGGARDRDTSQERKDSLRHENIPRREDHPGICTAPDRTGSVGRGGPPVMFGSKGHESDRGLPDRNSVQGRIGLRRQEVSSSKTSSPRNNSPSGQGTSRKVDIPGDKQKEGRFCSKETAAQPLTGSTSNKNENLGKEATTKKEVSSRELVPPTKFDNQGKESLKTRVDTLKKDDPLVQSKPSVQNYLGSKEKSQSIGDQTKKETSIDQTEKESMQIRKERLNKENASLSTDPKTMRRDELPNSNVQPIKEGPPNLRMHIGKPDSTKRDDNLKKDGALKTDAPPPNNDGKQKAIDPPKMVDPPKPDGPPKTEASKTDTQKLDGHVKMSGLSKGDGLSKSGSSSKVDCPQMQDGPPKAGGPLKKEDEPRKDGPLKKLDLPQKDVQPNMSGPPSQAGVKSLMGSPLKKAGEPEREDSSKKGGSMLKDSETRKDNPPKKDGLPKRDNVPKRGGLPIRGGIRSLLDTPTREVMVNRGMTIIRGGPLSRMVGPAIRNNPVPQDSSRHFGLRGMGQPFTRGNQIRREGPVGRGMVKSILGPFDSEGLSGPDAPWQRQEDRAESFGNRRGRFFQSREAEQAQFSEEERGRFGEGVSVRGRGGRGGFRPGPERPEGNFFRDHRLEPPEQQHQLDEQCEWPEELELNTNRFGPPDSGLIPRRGRPDNMGQLVRGSFRGRFQNREHQGGNFPRERIPQPHPMEGFPHHDFEENYDQTNFGNIDEYNQEWETGDMPPREWHSRGCSPPPGSRGPPEQYEEWTEPYYESEGSERTMYEEPRPVSFRPRGRGRGESFDFDRGRGRGIQMSRGRGRGRGGY